jgi:ATP dependent DNA ligase domain
VAVKAIALPSFVEPMKAKLAKAPSSGDWIYEIKFDGWRAIALKGGNQIRLLSRNSKDLGAKFPEIIVSIAELKARDAIIDGEIVALDGNGRSSFQFLQAHGYGAGTTANIFLRVRSAPVERTGHEKDSPRGTKSDPSTVAWQMRDLHRDQTVARGNQAYLISLISCLVKKFQGSDSEV